MAEPMTEAEARERLAFYATFNDAADRTRAAGEGCTDCHGRHRCQYHEGWHDALDRLEDEFDG